MEIRRSNSLLLTSKSYTTKYAKCNKHNSQTDKRILKNQKQIPFPSFAIPSKCNKNINMQTNLFIFPFLVDSKQTWIIRDCKWISHVSSRMLTIHCKSPYNCRIGNFFTCLGSSTFPHQKSNFFEVKITWPKTPQKWMKTTANNKTNKPPNKQK